MERIYYVSPEDCTEHEPVKGWYIDDGCDLPLGPYRTKDDVKQYLVSRENWRQFYAGL